jgi:hypothetical protein
MFNATLYLIRQRLAALVAPRRRYALATVRVLTVLGCALVALGVGQSVYADYRITNYVISVKTGCRDGNGTDARVFITMKGDRGEMISQELDNPNRNDFERCQIDQFTLRGVAQVGKISRVIVWHDNSGSRPGWFLESLHIFDIELGQGTEFRVDQWLSTSDWPYETFVLLERR